MISIATWMAIFFILLVIKYVIITPIEDKRMYKMYEARDSVALNAFQKKINQHSREYKFVIGIINLELYYCKNDYNFIALYNNLLKMPVRNKDYFTSMMDKVKNDAHYSLPINIAYREFIKHINLRYLLFALLVIAPTYMILKAVNIIMNIVLDALVKAQGVSGARRRVKKETWMDKLTAFGNTCRDYMSEDPYKC